MISNNLIAYFIYGIITFFITIRVGWICYKNGIHFIELEIQDKLIAANINKLLLTGYYLLNLGYASVMVYTWDTVSNANELIESVVTRSGYIIFSLGVMHYLNIFILSILKKKNDNSFHHH
jgi:hypothetical protein